MLPKRVRFEFRTPVIRIMLNYYLIKKNNEFNYLINTLTQINHINKKYVRIKNINKNIFINITFLHQKSTIGPHENINSMGLGWVLQLS